MAIPTWDTCRPSVVKKTRSPGSSSSRCTRTDAVLVAHNAWHREACTGRARTAPDRCSRSRADRTRRICMGHPATAARRWRSRSRRERKGAWAHRRTRMHRALSPERKAFWLRHRPRAAETERAAAARQTRRTMPLRPRPPGTAPQSQREGESPAGAPRACSRYRRARARQGGGGIMRITQVLRAHRLTGSTGPPQYTVPWSRRCCSTRLTSR